MSKCRIPATVSTTDSLRFLMVLLNRSRQVPEFLPRLFLGRFLPNPFQTHHSLYNSILCTLRFWEHRKINHWGNSLVVESIECKSHIWTGWRKEGRKGMKRKDKKKRGGTTLCDSSIRPRMINHSEHPDVAMCSNRWLLSLPHSYQLLHKISWSTGDVESGKFDRELDTDSCIKR